MSEGLKQTIPVTIIKYKYYNLRDVTIKQLVDNQIIQNGNYSKILANKPDGLILDDKRVIAVIEYKDTSQFNTREKKDKAISQSIGIAKTLKAKILITTDGSTSEWINTFNSEKIINENDKPVVYVFNYKTIPDDELLEKLIDQIDCSVTKDNSKIITPKTLDPYLLAKRIWQKIWINTGKEPEKCLYNVVELFIFKYLSDLGILKSESLLDFNTLYKISLSSNSDALSHYANVIREKIRELFPRGSDNTTIINGTIFVTEDGSPNLAQSRLFCELLRDFYDYEKEFGTFRTIDKNFKTKLFESFLKQSAGIKRLGQFFTPRKIVQAIIRMSDLDSLKSGSKICDPFCGVGGFLLESINLNKSLQNQFKPKKGKISPSIKIQGFDQGTDEKEDERTIILAKANMLIYLSDILAEYHSERDIKEISALINSSFELIRDNLGTLKYHFEENEKFDIIFSNPPYVSKGAKSIKDEIVKRGLEEYYSFNGTGIEGQCVEWIIRNLNAKGKAIIVIPDSILRRTSDKNLRENILKYCYVDGIISLPSRTFYATAKKTYILALTKKEDINDVQSQPVFTYIVREIGESRDANRIETPETNDLPDMINSFNQFKGNKDSYVPTSSLCKKIDDIDLPILDTWIIENLWTKEEKQKLNILEENETLSFDDFQELIKDAMIELNKLEYDLSLDIQRIIFKQIQLGDGCYFKPLTTMLGFTQKVYIPLNEDCRENIPIYTAQKEFVARIPKIIEKEPYICNKDKPHISIASDGDGTAGTNIVLHTENYYLNTSRISYEILNTQINPKYIYYMLQSIKTEYGFNYSHKATLQNQSVVSIPIPLDEAGQFDEETQIIIVKKYEQIDNIKERIKAIMMKISSAKIVLK